MYDVVIIGAGPAGLAAAIAAGQQGLRYQVLEKGALVNSLLHYPTDMIFFTTPELLEIGGMPFVSPYEKPTRHEALKYYRRVVDAHRLAVLLGEKVIRLERVGESGFQITSRSTARGDTCYEARAVVMASGAYDMPNRLGVPGEDLPHVTHYYREAHPYYRRRVLIVGGKNSAADAALEIYRTSGQVLLVYRRERLSDSIKYWVKPDIENRIKEGAIEARFSTTLVEIEPTRVLLDGPGGREWVVADDVLLLTGYKSDTALLEQVGAALDESIGAPRYDPQTFETSVPNLFVIGACVAGQQSGHIFIENGRFHGEVVIREIAQRLRAATSVGASG